MSQRNVRWTVRELRARLRELGCYHERTKGSHESWRLPNGDPLPPFVGNYANAVVHVKGLKRALKERGIDLDNG